MTPVAATSRRFFSSIAVLLLSIAAAIALSWVAAAPAGAREFTPEIQMSVDPATADTAPQVTQTLLRDPLVPFVDKGEQPIKYLTMLLPYRWRVNGESLQESCPLDGDGNLNPEDCPAGSEIGTVDTQLSLLGIPLDVGGKVYDVRADHYYSFEQLGNQPGWVEDFKDLSANGGALPVIVGIQLDPLLGGLVKLPPIYMESYLSEDNYRIGIDMKLDKEGENFFTSDAFLTAFVERMDLFLNGGDHGAAFRTAVTEADACSGPQVFDVTASSWADEYDPEQTAVMQPSVDLTGCDQVSAPFESPRVSSVEASTTAAGANPKLTLKMERDAGDASITSMKMTLPEGMLGSPYATTELCDDEQAAQAACPAASKVAEAAMQVDVFENREVNFKANVYNATTTGSELARFLTVIKTPPIALQQVQVLPVYLNILPGVKGIEAELNDVPPEFDVRHIEFTFDGTTGTDIGHPLLVNPSSCDEGKISVEFGSEIGQTQTSEAPYTATDCDTQPYDPQAKVELTCTDPHCAPELTATITQNPGEATTKDMRISIPSGFVINDKSSVTPCSDADVNAKTCPDSSQIGTATAESPLAAEPLSGKIYLAEPAEGDTTSLRRIHAEITGLVDISLDGTLVTNDQGGFDIVLSDMPEVPLSKIEMVTQGGEDRGLIYTPFDCGTKEFTATATSHSGRVVTKTYDLNVTGSGCAPTLNVRLDPDRAKERPKLDLIVRPNAGTKPIKTMKFKLGSGSKKLKVRGVSLTGKERRSVSRRCSSRRTKKSKKRCKSRNRPSVTIGSLKLKPTDGKTTKSSLVSKSRRSVKTKTKKRGTLSTSKLKVTLRKKGQIVIRGLPDTQFTELRIRIQGDKRKVLKNPKHKGTITFKGYFWDADGTKYAAKATDKVRSAKKKSKKKKKK